MMDFLPNECLFRIIGNLGFNDLLTCQQVSRRFSAISTKELSRCRLLNIVIHGVGENFDHSDETGNEEEGKRTLLVTRTVNENWTSYIGMDDMTSVDGVFVCYSVNYPLAREFPPEVLEKELQQVWASVFMLLRCCDTKHLRVDLQPGHNVSTWPAWDVFHQGNVSECSLTSSGIDPEPKWTVNKLVSLIQKWQNGAAFQSLDFLGYSYEGENEMTDDAFFTEALKMLENIADEEAFQYSTDILIYPSHVPHNDDEELGKLCSIHIVNSMNGTKLHVSFLYIHRQVPCMVTRSGVRRQVIDRSTFVLRCVSLSQMTD